MRVPGKCASPFYKKRLGGSPSLEVFRRTASLHREHAPAVLRTAGACMRTSFPLRGVQCV